MRDDTTFIRPPGRPKHTDGVDVQHKILVHASRLFMDGGYEAVSLGSIAQAAGITKASIYYYFSTKADLFASAMEWILDTIHRESQRILNSPGSLRDRLGHLTLVRLQVPQTRFDFSRVISEAEPQLTVEQQQRVRRSLDQIATLIIDKFHEAAQQGDIRSVDPVLLGHSYLALLNVAFAKNLQGQPLFPDAVRTSQELMQLLFSGLTGS